MKNKYLLICLLLTLMAPVLSAQQFSPDTYQVSGKVIATSGQVMANVEVTLMGVQQTWRDTTDMSGQYHFDNVPEKMDYQLTFKKDGNFGNGLDQLDVRLLKNHLVGLGSLNRNAIFAADLDGTWALNVFDVILMECQIAVGGTQFDPNWQFVFAYADIDPVNPYIGLNESPIPWHLNAYQITQLSHDLQNIDFVAVKMGDMNQSADPDE